jgi:multiple sugar transport system permease protein
MMSMRSATLIKSVVVYVILLGWTAWLAFPLYWLVIAAFKPPLAVSAGATYLPFVDFTPTLKAFNSIFLGGMGSTDPSIPFSNSIIISFGSSFIALIIGAMAGYGLARFTYKVGQIGNYQISFFFISQRMFPVAVLAVPILIMFRELNLLDTQVGMIIAEIGFGTPFVAWIVRDFFAGLPKEIEESALIDGCSRLQVLQHIAFPLGAPGLVAAFILIFIGSWNDYFLALVLTFARSITIPLFIQVQAQYVTGVTPWANIAVITLVSILPPVIAGLALQRYITRGLTFGAVK